jgi:hypothetical protein
MSSLKKGFAGLDADHNLDDFDKDSDASSVIERMSQNFQAFLGQGSQTERLFRQGSLDKGNNILVL